MPEERWSPEGGSPEGSRCVEGEVLVVVVVGEGESGEEVEVEVMETAGPVRKSIPILNSSSVRVI